MKTPETDTKVVDYLYDDLPDAEREVYTSGLAADAEAAGEVEDFSELLGAYRQVEEIHPPAALTESLLAAAERVQRPLLARVFGDLLHGFALRPAGAAAIAAVLCVGVVVFVFLSRGGSPEKGRSPKQGSPALASAADGTDRERSEDRGGLAARGGETAVASASQPRGPTATGEAEANDKGRDRWGGQGSTRRGKLLGKKGKRGHKGIRGGLDDDNDTEADDAVATLSVGKERRVGGSGGQPRGRFSGRKLRGLEVGDNLRGKGQKNALAKAAPKPAAKAPSPPPPVALPKSGKGAGGASAPSYGLSANRRQLAKAIPQGTTATLQRQGKQKKQAEKGPLKPTAPALHNLAQTRLAQGKVATACSMYSSLVRQYRGYPRRADALLDWARCELARGDYQHADQLLRQLVKEYPRWQKGVQHWLAKVAKARNEARVRAARQREAASKRRTRMKRAARRPAAARRARSRSASADSLE